VSDAVQLLGQYADELGGEENLTAGQRALLQKLFRCMVALNPAFFVTWAGFASLATAPTMAPSTSATSKSDLMPRRNSRSGRRCHNMVLRCCTGLSFR
jgi:hypothetical protein